MTASSATAGTGTKTWTCPFCPLLCDGFALQTTADGSLALQGSDCPRARASLRNHRAAPSASRPQIGGAPCALPEAAAAATRLLRASRQPLFAGLGADVAGARALYTLAHDTGAICDASGGAALMQGLRVLQDRGAFTCTLAEVRNRADVIVCIGGSPTERQPEFFRRCGLGEAGVETRHVVFIGGSAADAAPLQGLPGLSTEVLATDTDLFDTLAQLAQAVAGRHAPAALAALAQRLLTARYAVLVWEGARLPAHGGLMVETLNRIVGTLNRSTRAAAFPLGGADGAATSNQVFSWLSGLPLRTRVTAAGLEHEPLAFDTGRLLNDGAVDLLMWVNAFGVAPPALPPGLPLIVLGTPAVAAQVTAPGSVFIPVTTPGIGAPGHLFRTDGVVLMPVHAAVDDGLPGVAAVVQQLREGLKP